MIFLYLVIIPVIAFTSGMLSSSSKITYASGSYFSNFLWLTILLMLILFLSKLFVFLYRVVKNSSLTTLRTFLFMLNVFWNKKLNNMLPKIYRWVRKIQGKDHVPTARKSPFLRESVGDFIKNNNHVYLTLPEKYNHNLAYYLFGEKGHTFNTLDQKKQSIVLIFLMQALDLTKETYNLRLLDLIKQDLTCGFALLSYPFSSEELLAQDKSKNFSITSNDFLQAIKADVLYFKETYKFHEQSEEDIYLYLRFGAIEFFLLHNKVAVNDFTDNEDNVEIFTRLLKSIENYTDLQEMLLMLERTFAKEFSE